MASSTKRFLSNYFSLLLLIIIVKPFSAYAQNILGDTKGKSTLSVNPGAKATSKDSAENKLVIEEIPFNLGLIKFSTSDKRVDLTYYSYFTPKNSDHHFFVGVTGGGAVKSSLSSLFATNNVVSGAEATLKTGVRLWKNQEDWATLIAKRGQNRTPEQIQDILDNYTRPASDLWFVINATYSGSAFKHFQPDSAFSKQIQQTNFSGYEVSAGFNYWNARVLDQTILAGATIGVKQTNNFDDLTEGTYEDTRTVMDATTNTTRKVVVKETVYSGTYKVSQVYPLNFDLYVVPQNAQNIGFLGYSRTDFGKEIVHKTKLGVGVYFLKNQNAFNPIAGLTFEYSDAFNVDHTDDSSPTINKLKISISTRIVIVNNQKRNN